MDLRTLVLICMVAMLACIFTVVEGRTKKVVIHVPYKVKKIKHTHTIYKTIHHHHSHRDPHLLASGTEEHEHFHHMHIHEEPPVPGVHAGAQIPEFLPLDAPLDLPIELPDVPDLPPLQQGRRQLPLYRRP